MNQERGPRTLISLGSKVGAPHSSGKSEGRFQLADAPLKQGEFNLKRVRGGGVGLVWEKGRRAHDLEKKAQDEADREKKRNRCCRFGEISETRGKGGTKREGTMRLSDQKDQVPYGVAHLWYAIRHSLKRKESTLRKRQEEK